MGITDTIGAVNTGVTDVSSLYQQLFGGGSDTPPSAGAYPNATALNYKGDYDHQYDARAVPASLVSTLLSVASATDLEALQSAYLRARPKAIWSEVVTMPGMIGIAAAGGDDFVQNADESALWTLLQSDFNRYGITAGQTLALTQPQNTTSPAAGQPSIDTPWYEPLVKVGENVVKTVENVVTGAGKAAVASAQTSSQAAATSTSAVGSFVSNPVVVFIVIVVLALLVLRHRKGG